jgi:hypothetical protein
VPRDSTYPVIGDPLQLTYSDSVTQMATDPVSTDTVRIWSPPGLGNPLTGYVWIDELEIYPQKGGASIGAKVQAASAGVLSASVASFSSGSAQFRINCPKTGNLNMEVVDISGRAVWKSSAVAKAGSNEIQTPGMNLVGGLYVLVAGQNGQQASRKFAVMQ